MTIDNLIGAVNRTVKDPDVFSDRFVRSPDLFTIQRGCYILNHWGYEPILTYPKYLKGPFSFEIAKSDCMDTDIPDDVIQRLSEILKDEDYSIAYCLLLLIKKNNPHLPMARIVKKALEVSPSLEDKIYSACKDLYDELS